jgi:hypothetical protein
MTQIRDVMADYRRCNPDTWCHLLCRWVWECHKTRRWQTDVESGDAYCRNADEIFHVCTVDELLDASRHDIIKADFKLKLTQEGYRDALRDDTKQHRTSKRQQKNTHRAFMSLVKTQDKTLVHRCLASRSQSSDAATRSHIWERWTSGCH